MTSALVVLLLAAGATLPVRALAQDIPPATGSRGEAGFSASYFSLPNPVSTLSDVDFDAPPDATGVVDGLIHMTGEGPFWQDGPTDLFAAHYSATLAVSQAGSYTFHLTSDDGSTLLIDGALLIDNDGVHAATKQSVTIDLEAGAHPIEVFYFEVDGGQVLTLDWSGPDTGEMRQMLRGAALASAEGTAATPLPEPGAAPANMPPQAGDDAAETEEGRAVTIDVLANDRDADGDALAIGELRAPANGRVERADGGIRYMPAAGFGGTDSFSYTATDGRGGTDTGIVDVVVAYQEVDTALGLLEPSLGMGLSGITDWSVQQPFIDVMKNARSWVGHLPDQWGGMSEEELREGGHLDRNGWVMSIPETVTGVGSVVLSLPEAASSSAGRYRLTYDGEGRLELHGRAQGVSYGRGEIWFNYVPGNGSVHLELLETDPNATGNHIRNISIVKEENLVLHEAGAIFNPDWIDRIDDLRVVRFMDWMATNDSRLSEWGERPQVSDYSYMPTGVPLEIMVALANEIGADPWFTMPHQASDDYMRKFAEHVRDALDPQLRAYVEFSNEVWNWQFDQAHWAMEGARDRWDVDDNGAWLQFAAMRAVRMAQIWDEAFGAEADRRLIKVLSTQTGWLGLEDYVLGAPLWRAEDPANRPPAEYFDAWAVTGYFSANLGLDDKAPVVKEWLAESRAAAEAAATEQGLSGDAHATYVQAHRFDQAVVRAEAELRSGSETGNPEASLDYLLREVLPHHASVATARGLDLVMYEGGTHVVGIGDWVDDEELTEFFVHLNYTPEMGGLYRTLLEGWTRLGGTLFNAFVDLDSPSKWGSWGALRSLDDDNPRWDALMAFNEATPADWEARRPDTFDHGALLEGSPGDDTLEGTVEEDILLGLAGDDLLISNGKSDRLHGGPGDDAALLPGRRADYRFDREENAIVVRSSGGVSRLIEIETALFAEEPGVSVPISNLF